MGVVTIVGAGMMGSALSFPSADNGHEIRLVGTPLDRKIIEQVKRDNVHPKLQRRLPPGVRAFQIEAMGEALKGADLLIGGVSSFGVEWFGENVLPFIPRNLPLLLVTKGLLEGPGGSLTIIPEYLSGRANGELAVNAIGGPCTSYELADRRHSSVCFCGKDAALLRELKEMLSTEYYHISLSTDMLGVEAAVALKNAYALCVSLAIGLNEREQGAGQEAYNPQAALFGQAMREMTSLVELLGGSRESVAFGVSDLYVTIFGGRTRRLGILLGRGLSMEEALQELEGVTLESVAIVSCAGRALRQLEAGGLIEKQAFPLLNQIDGIINQNKAVDIPWKQFEKSFV